MASQGGKEAGNKVSKTLLTAVVSGGLALTVIVYIICFWSSIYDSLHTSRYNNDIDNKVVRITKRTVEGQQMFDYYTNCVVAEPSKADIQKLCGHHDCASVHCVQTYAGDVSNGCTPVSMTTCFTKACTTFKVVDRNNNTVQADVKLTYLSGIVNAYLSQMENIKNIDVTCSDYNSYLFDKNVEIEITGDKSNKCVLEKVADSHSASGSKSNTEINRANITGSNVYLIYFRFMSKWESFLNLPRLNAFIENKRKDKSWELHTFERVQSHSLVLEDNLRSVFGLPEASSKENTKENLVGLAADNGFCVILNVLACHKSDIYSEINRTVNGENNTRNCHQDKYEHNDIKTTTDNNNQSFCNTNNGETDIDDALYIHDRLAHIYTTTATDIFSVSVINIPDVTSSSIFDSAITKLVTQIVSQRSNVLILMSDVGDPKFSRFDESVFLRLQTFNPLLQIFISRATSLTNPVISPFISDLRMKEIKTLVTAISDVHGLTRALILAEEEGERETRKLEENKIKNGSGITIRGDSKPGELCPVRRIRGPIECLCQGNHVRFPNDSVQVAFASLIVGSLNNKLLELSSPHDSLKSKTVSRGGNSHDKGTDFLKDRFNCDRLIGATFNSVYHVLWKNSTYILMTLHLRPTSRRNSRVIRIDAEVQYTTDDSYNTIFSVNLIHPTKVPLASLSDGSNKSAKKLLHLLCQPPNELNMDRTGHIEYLHFISSENHFGMKAKIKSLQHPCLFLITRISGDGGSVEAANVCDDRMYNLTVSAQFINVMPLSVLPVDVTLGPRETRYISTLVKNAYGVTRSVYKIKTYYTFTLF